MTALMYVLERINNTLHEVKDNFPLYTDAEGKWVTSKGEHWMEGFWIGMLWHAYTLTEKNIYKEKALMLIDKLRNRVKEKTHDLGFLFYYSAVLGYKITKDEYLKDIAIMAADSLSMLYNPKVKIIPLGRGFDTYFKIPNHTGENDTIIDTLMSALPLLWWAWKETDNSKYYEIAINHLKTSINWHVREDGSTYQSVHFDPHTGKILYKHTHQGFSSESCWTRGQAWAIYGLALAYSYTREDFILENAKKVSDYFVNNLPKDDPIPFYDFQDPKIPNTNKDTSAAAIAASALLLLNELIEQKSSSYHSYANNILSTLVTKYLTPISPLDNRPKGMLLHGCYRKDLEGSDSEIIFGDYYLMEALLRVSGKYSL
jgi:unsaturated chondroitin disaccharide hydrolase